MVLHVQADAWMNGWISAYGVTCADGYRPMVLHVQADTWMNGWISAYGVTCAD